MLQRGHRMMKILNLFWLLACMVRVQAFHTKRPRYCMEPRVTGTCRNYVVAWYFDNTRNYCKIFLYGGCGGNENKFSSEIRCQQMCLPGSTPQRFCGAQPQLTPCNSREQQWYFHPHRRICLPYRHGRCGRKGNNAFESCVQCMNRCTDRKSEEVCKMVQRKILSRGRHWSNRTTTGKFRNWPRQLIT
uniref:Monolaris n=1 Tax=Rhipicephalus zambeziensis TaxID=60191 RepID=A0A224YCZ4_9ACAR